MKERRQHLFDFLWAESIPFADRYGSQETDLSECRHSKSEERFYTQDTIPHSCNVIGKNIAEQTLQ